MTDAEIDEGPTCPKCGAAETAEFTRYYTCDSYWTNGELIQGDGCRIRELEADNVRLRERVKQLEEEVKDYERAARDE